MADSNIHTPGDGRGGRRVYVNGHLMKSVVYADTRRGVVRYHDDPPRMDKRGKRWIDRTRRGKVELQMIDGPEVVLPLVRGADGRLRIGLPGAHR